MISTVLSQWISHGMWLLAWLFLLFSSVLMEWFVTHARDCTSHDINIVPAGFLWDIIRISHAHEYVMQCSSLKVWIHCYWHDAAGTKLPTNLQGLHFVPGAVWSAWHCAGLADDRTAPSWRQNIRWWQHELAPCSVSRDGRPGYRPGARAGALLGM